MVSLFDVIVIGSGPAGYVAAIRSAQLGLKTACVEQWMNNGRVVYGGTCLNVGCIPSKTLLEISHKFIDAKANFEKIGINFENISINVKKMIRHKNKIVYSLNDGIAALFKANGVVVLRGSGKILTKKTVEVLHKGKLCNFQAKNIIIASGSIPRCLNQVPFNGDTIIDSAAALNLQEVPNRLGIIGAGIIGIELGSVWSRLGSKVTIFESLDKLLPVIDFSLSKQISQILKKQGLNIKFNVRIIGSEIVNNEVKVRFIDHFGEHCLTFDKLIVCIGRMPFTQSLIDKESGLVIATNGFIKVDRQCKTNLSGIYAVGDVVRGPMLAHKAAQEGIMVAELIAGNQVQLNYDTIPGVIYTSPEVAWVGKNEQQLISYGIKNYKIGIFPFANCGRARTSNEIQGLVKIITDVNDIILGVHIIGHNASELIAQGVIAMEFSSSAEDLALTCFAHPTLSEAIHEAACTASLGNTIHNI
ncbi:dihydrolipoyl dehydrogenase [Candidatus Portiera aleyrodidarum]|uniref:Dihydrolipoyl dehydrogenase n=1 Tax=Candidatus Portiera aleyrodidarum MED (Bemisia tabaci) TaxID=1163752 RepID=A0AAU8RQS6_9GAMM|nr:dihydrolipoyl dehydrogenase [Candidatus Portiera aleyrodidarum]AFS18850.1 Dihydrolipoamide dehydrogenase [Candidatus Portiera aleyrodidarum BT-QVLC]AFT80478.1 Dihydrolipoamide dehydrogenase of 2-oxoglutarate dehydrogenase [Candidatus Portiera aleyrodidarum BT-QVLC]AJF24062.1 dihydrolipoamide dehydrogenase [Candidatus Portiera aleyrodidarum MED (Bemisia tabaci)]